MFADHGARFSKVRATAQGKQEERLPYFGLRFPEWLSKKYPEIIKNVRSNTKSLTTPFDVHETLHEIVNFTGKGIANIRNRGVSLFKAIPEERDCHRAQIDHHWCACLQWEQVAPGDPVLKQITDKILEAFNNFTESYRNECAKLSIKNITSALTLKVNDAVSKFNATSDGGRGRFGKMDDTTEHAKVLYQVSLMTQPGGGSFDVTVSHVIKENIVMLSKGNISRTNAYSNDSYCIDKLDRTLAPYCYCNARNMMNLEANV